MEAERAIGSPAPNTSSPGTPEPITAQKAAQNLVLAAKVVRRWKTYRFTSLKDELLAHNALVKVCRNKN